MLEKEIVGYYPFKDGKRSGDVVEKGGNHIQVKRFDGAFTQHETLENTLQLEYANTFIIWTDKWEGYFEFTTEQLITVLSGRLGDKLVREVDRNGVKKYRLEMGIQKRKWIGEYFHTASPDQPPARVY